MFPMLIPQVLRIERSYDQGRYDNTVSCEPFASQLISSGCNTRYRASARDLGLIYCKRMVSSLPVA